MKRRRNLLVVLLLVCAMGIGVGYAALTTNMTVNGKAEIAKIDSKVVFTNAVIDTANSTDGVTIGELTGTNTATLGWTVSGLKNVNDKAVVYVTISNPHDFDVTVKNTNLTEPTAANAKGTKYFTVVKNALTDGETIAANSTKDFTITITCGATNATDDVVSDTFTLTFVAEAVVTP